MRTSFCLNSEYVCGKLDLYLNLSIFHLNNSLSHSLTLSPCPWTVPPPPHFSPSLFFSLFCGCVHACLHMLCLAEGIGPFKASLFFCVYQPGVSLLGVTQFPPQHFVCQLNSVLSHFGRMEDYQCIALCSEC